MEKEEQRDNFRTLLGLKENDIMNREEYTISSQSKCLQMRKQNHNILF